MNIFWRYLSAAILFLPIFDSASALGFQLSTQQAVSIVEIQQVINFFAIAVDQKRWDLLSQVFDPDVTANFNVPGSPVLHGLPAIVELLRRLEDYPSFHGQSSHYVDMSNAERPHAITYITGVFFGADRVYTNYGRYEDDLVHTAQGWRIISRTYLNTASVGGTNNITASVGNNKNITEQ